MNKLRYSLSRKFSLGIILMAVPMFVLSLGVFFFYVRNFIHQSATEHANSILNTTMQNVVNYMSAVENAAKSNAWLLEDNFTPDSLEAISQRIVTRNRSIISCSIGTEPDMFPQKGRYFSVFTLNDGDTIYTVREPDYEYFEKMWYKTARNSDKACWINPFSDYAEAALDHNNAVASYSLPLHTRDGRIAGIVATDFSFTNLGKIITATAPPYPHAYYTLLGGDGRYLIHPNENLLFKKTIFSENDANDNANLVALGHEMTAGESGTIHATIDGEYCHVTFRAVPGTNWSLALVVQASELMSPYLYLRNVVIVLIILGLLGILFLSYRVVRQTIAPINQLMDMTKKIADGEYSEVIPLSDQKDAVARLQNSFAAMQQSIKTQMERISHTAQEIGEHHVEEEEKLEEAEMAINRKNQFVTNVMDQIKQPLNTIKDCVRLLRDSHDIPKEEIAALAKKLNYNTNKLNRLVLMLFDSSEAMASDASLYDRDNDVSCNQMARDCVTYTEGLFPGMKMRFETVVPDSFHIQTNYLYLMRSIRELLYNAAKYSDGQHILVKVSQTADAARFTIQDVGPGLPDNPSDLLFKPFMKVDNYSEGFGLGLPLCMRHVVGLGGKLIYDADYKDGCRFFLELPK